MYKWSEHQEFWQKWMAWGSSPVNAIRYNHFIEILLIPITLWSPVSHRKCPCFIQGHLDYNFISFQMLPKLQGSQMCHIFVPHWQPHLKQTTKKKKIQFNKIMEYPSIGVLFIYYLFRAKCWFPWKSLCKLAKIDLMNPGLVHLQS